MIVDRKAVEINKGVNERVHSKTNGEEETKANVVSGSIRY